MTPISAKPIRVIFAEPSRNCALAASLIRSYSSSICLSGSSVSSFSTTETTAQPTVGIGAPTHVFLPTVARALGAPCVVPEHAAVANAVGAICSEVIGESAIRVVPHRIVDGVVDGFMIMHPEWNRMVETPEEALELAESEARRLAIESAVERGVQGDVDCEVSTSRQNIGNSTTEIPFEWNIRAVAHKARD